MSNVLFKRLYKLLVLVFAKPKFQKFFEILYRINLGFLGYMNWSSDFRLTGERLALEQLKFFEIKLALDVGANKGQWAEMATETLNCKVISIEPQTSAFSELKILAKKKESKILALNYAVGHVNKKIKLNIHEISSELSYIDSRINNLPLLTHKAKNFEEVEMITLDTLYYKNKKLFSNVDFVKIDTEGFEFNVLKGGKDFINLVKPKFIQIEMNWHQLFVETSLLSISKIIPKYDIYKILPGGTCFYKINPVDSLSNLFQLCNFICIRQDLKFDDFRNLVKGANYER